MSFELFTSVYTSAGGRTQNEDCARHIDTKAGSCWVLADGLGGHAGGQVASETAASAILESFEAAPGCSPEALQSLFEAAQSAVRTRQQSDPELADMRTTAVVLISNGECALWGHVGDSRLYLFRDGSILLRTHDHSVPQALTASGHITEHEIRFHEDRNRLLRTLGGPEEVRPTLGERHQLQTGDAFLLATDGFWEYVLEVEMEIDLCKSVGPESWLRLMNRRLRRTAPESHDNYSAMSILTGGIRS